MWLPFLSLTCLLIANMSLCHEEPQSPEETIRIKPQGPVYRGALIDDYKREVLILKVTSPSDVIKRVIDSLVPELMRKEDYEDVRIAFGYLEKIFEDRFRENLQTYSQSLSSHRPVSSTGITSEIELTHKISKRSPLRFLLALSRSVRPIAKLGNKISKYGKFWKTVKYASYVAGAGTFTYEIVNAAGLVPDVKYETLMAEIDKIHASRATDLSYLNKLTLATTQTSDAVTDLYVKLNDLLGSAKNQFEIQLQGSIILNSYLSSLQNAFSLLSIGKIPTSLMGLDTQRAWLEKKLPSALLGSIGSISPHLPVLLENIDAENNLLLFRIDVPVVDTRFQLLNYIEWEPSFFLDSTCFTSPVPMLYLAYPLYREGSEVVKDPLMLDPRSCLSSGFILCESDAILQSIPDIGENRLCTKHHRLNTRHKREAEDLFYEANNHPEYDIGRLVSETLRKRKEPVNLKIEISPLLQKIEQMKNEAEAQRANSQMALREAAHNQTKLYMVYVFSVIGAGLVIYLVKVLYIICSTYIKKKEAEALAALRRETALGVTPSC